MGGSMVYDVLFSAWLRVYVFDFTAVLELTPVPGHLFMSHRPYFIEAAVILVLLGQVRVTAAVSHAAAV